MCQTELQLQATNLCAFQQKISALWEKKIKQFKDVLPEIILNGLVVALTAFFLCIAQSRVLLANHQISRVFLFVSVVSENLWQRLWHTALSSDAAFQYGDERLTRVSLYCRAAVWLAFVLTCIYRPVSLISMKAAPRSQHTAEAFLRAWLARTRKGSTNF